MSNLLSTLLSEWTSRKAIAKEKGATPRVWFSYVDKVSTVVQEGRFDEILATISKACLNIIFTAKSEFNESVPFLDLKIQMAAKIRNILETHCYPKNDSSNMHKK